jgi:hypothetical protein
MEVTTKWMADKQLLGELEKDDALKNSDTRLANFYNEQVSKASFKFMKFNMLSEQLNDENILSDIVSYNNIVNQMEQFNNAVIAEIGAESITKLANQYQIKDLRNQFESLTTNEISELESLAKMCPMIGGEGVYKARSLYSYFNPLSDYDDNSICSSYGLNKTENGFVTYNASNEHFKLYPNPANDYLIVEYDLNKKDQAEILMYDMVGKLILKYELSNSAKNMKLNISNVSRGNYIVKYMKNNLQIEQYKIQIQ